MGLGQQRAGQGDGSAEDGAERENPGSNNAFDEMTYLIPTHQGLVEDVTIGLDRRCVCL